MMEFRPENELDNAILKAKNGQISIKEMMKVFFVSYVYIISLDEKSASDESVVHEDWQNFFPLRFDVDGRPMAAVFSSLSKAQSYNHKSMHILKMLGREQILRVPPGNGIVLNAGYDAQIKVMPSGIDEMKEHLKGVQVAEEKLSDFKPDNALEEMILAARQGVRSSEEMLDLLAESDIYVSSKNDFQSDWSGFDPFLITYEGETYIAVFSSLDRPDSQRHQTKHILQIAACDLMKRLAPEYGLVMNPGYFAYFLVPPSELAECRKKLTRL